MKIWIKELLDFCVVLHSHSIYFLVLSSKSIKNPTLPLITKLQIDQEFRSYNRTFGCLYIQSAMLNNVFPFCFLLQNNPNNIVE
jgi:hypothetical protein